MRWDELLPGDCYIYDGCLNFVVTSPKKRDYRSDDILLVWDVVAIKKGGPVSTDAAHLGTEMMLVDVTVGVPNHCVVLVGLAKR